MTDEVMTCEVCAVNESSKVTRHGETCAECVADMIACHACEEMTHPDYFLRTRGGLAICEDCQVRSYSWCEFCEVLVLDEYYEGDLDRCRRCAHEDFTQCDSCGYWVHDADLLCDDRGAYCETCYEPDRPEGVHEYKSGAPWGLDFITYAHGTENRTRDQWAGAYFGVEFELAGYERDLGDILARAEDMRDAHAETDSSVEGIELISQPATLEAWRGFYGARISDYLSDLRERGYFAHDDQCGAHVHISRLAFEGSRHLATFAAFFTYNPDFVLAISGRNSLERWASLKKWSAASGESLRDAVRGNRRSRGSRYRAVNLTNARTVEVRIWAGTDDFECTLGSIEFLAALIEFTRGLSSGDVLAGALLADTFTTWLEDEPQRARFAYALELIKVRAHSALVHAIA